MKILLLTPHLPEPARQGTALRNGALLRHLGARHTVDLLTFLAPGETLDADNPLYSWCRRVAALPQPERSTRVRLRDTFTTLLPDMALRLHAPAMHALLAQWLAEAAAHGGYDIVQAEGIEMARYAMQAASAMQGAAQEPGRVVFDNHNCEYLLQKRNALTDLRQSLRHPQRLPAAAYSLVQWAKLRRYEAQACRSADAVLAVSDADADALRALGAAGRQPIAPVVITNGIDLDTYHLAPEPQNARQEARSPQGGNNASAPPATLVFTGKMDYRPNVDAVLWFAREVLPAVLAAMPQVRLQIVGRNPHARLDALRSHPAIEITGAVDDVRPWLWQAGVCLIPLRVGGGTRFKALEALACGAPVVSTQLGVEGLGARHGHELLLADSPAAMVDAICTLLAPQNSALRAFLRRNGRTFVEQNYGWQPIVARLETLYAQLLT